MVAQSDFQWTMETLKKKNKILRCVRNVHMLAHDVFDIAKWHC